MNSIQKSLHEALADLKKRYPIDEMAVFGSHANGTMNNSSDVDILVSFSGPMGIKFIDLADELEILLGKKVDLITKKSLKPRQWEYLKDKLVYV